jgi:hypothetical protein
MKTPREALLEEIRKTWDALECFGDPEMVTDEILKALETAGYSIMPIEREKQDK